MTSLPQPPADAATPTTRLVARNSALRALNVIGDGWILRIIRDAFRGTRRFSDWQSQLGIPRSVLTSRLERLVDAGIMQRREYQAAPVRHEYVLSAMGRDLWRLYLAAWDWETTWFPNPHTMRLHLVHLSCGSRCRPILCQEETLAPLTPDDIVQTPGPGAGLEADLPPRARRRANSAIASLSSSTFLKTETAHLLGDRWTASILYHALHGIHRFSDFAEATGMSPSLLSSRLDELTQIDVMVREQASANSLRHQYLLTPKGKATFAWMLLLQAWGDRWLSPSLGPPILSVDKRTGRPVRPTLICSHCQGKLEPSRIQLF